jgi:hypothetical protein
MDRCEHGTACALLAELDRAAAPLSAPCDSCSIVRCGSVIIPPSQSPESILPAPHCWSDHAVCRQVSDCIWPSLHAAPVSAASH